MFYFYFLDRTVLARRAVPTHTSADKTMGGEFHRATCTYETNYASKKKEDSPVSPCSSSLALHNSARMHSAAPLTPPSPRPHACLSAKYKSRQDSLLQGNICPNLHPHELQEFVRAHLDAPLIPELRVNAKRPNKVLWRRQMYMPRMGGGKDGESKFCYCCRGRSRIIIFLCLVVILTIALLLCSVAGGHVLVIICVAYINPLLLYTFTCSVIARQDFLVARDAT